MWSTENLVVAIQKTLAIFTDVWSQMCKPFIEAVHTTEGGMIPHQEKFYPYVLIPIIIGAGFCMIALAKKVTFMLIERRD